MTLWAFILTVIYVPGYLGAQIPSGWAFLSITLPFLTWGPTSTPPAFKYLGLAFIGWALLSLWWAPDPQYGIFALWKLALFIGAFMLGAQIADPRPILRGLALGLSVSSILCIAQWFGWNPVYAFSNYRPAGLLFNPVSLSESIALVVIWLVVERMWAYIPPLVPGLILSQGRGAWLVLALFAALYAARHTRLWFLALGTIVLGLAGTLAYVLAHPEVDLVRISLWKLTFEHLSWLGSGAGALSSVLLNIGGTLASPEYSHNEFLDLGYQFGIGAAPAFAAILLCLLCRNDREWYVLAAFVVLASFSFPLHTPTIALVGGLAAGYLSPAWPLARRRLVRRGRNLLPWSTHRSHQSNHSWGTTLPL